MQPTQRIFSFTIFLSFILAFLAVSFAGATLAITNSGRIAYGVHFENTPLNGLSREQAAAFLTKAAQDRLARNALIFSYEDKTWQIAPQDINLTADIEATLDYAYSIGHSGSWLENLLENIHCAFYGRRITFIVSYDGTALKNKLDGIAAAVNTKPRSARCFLGDGGSIQHQPAVIGRSLDTEALAENVNDALLHLELPKRSQLIVSEAPPAITDEDLAQVDTVLSSYTTHFNGGNTNRSQNIRIAAGELDQQLIRNGGEFSFNQTVGSRAASAGYRDAAVIIEGKVEQDIGGGVCQVSSTLYNAVLLAGLQSTERTSHFYPSSYVPAGLDATVADGQLDFKFRNVLPHNVYLLSSVYGSTLTIFVLGTRADLDGSRITLRTRTEKPGPGPVVSAYRIYQKNGQEVNREFLHTDHYDVQG